jgi:hypothetical protein
MRVELGLRDFLYDAHHRRHHRWTVSFRQCECRGAEAGVATARSPSIRKNHRIGREPTSSYFETEGHSPSTHLCGWWTNSTPRRQRATFRRPTTTRHACACYFRSRSRSERSDDPRGDCDPVALRIGPVRQSGRFEGAGTAALYRRHGIKNPRQDCSCRGFLFPEDQPLF